MNSLRVRIDRLNLTLHGVSKLVAEHAVSGLDEELRRRLRTLPSFQPLSVHRSGASPPSIRGRNLDAATLRGLIADRLADQIRRAAGSEGSE